MLAAGVRAHLQQQKRAANLLFVGSTAVLIGCVLAATTGQMHVGSRATNYLGQPFPSGSNYQPNTVSNMVSDLSTPEGKAFFAFGLIGSVCLLVSWYPWELRNCYEGDREQLLFCVGPAWSTLRHFLPCGTLLVACLPVTPPANRQLPDRLVFFWHQMGAVFAVGGYMLTELQYLLYGMRHAGVTLSRVEWHCRLWLVAVGLALILTFLITDRVTKNFAALGCGDAWRVPTDADLEYLGSHQELFDLSAGAALARRTGRKLLYDTASGRCLVVKQVELWSEMFASMLMAVHLLVIWYFCTERRITFRETLPDVPEEELQPLTVQALDGTSPEIASDLQAEIEGSKRPLML